MRIPLATLNPWSLLNAVVRVSLLSAQVTQNGNPRLLRQAELKSVKERGICSMTGTEGQPRSSPLPLPLLHKAPQVW